MERVLKELIPSLTEQGAFGPGKFHSVTPYESSDNSFQFGSVIALVNLNLVFDSGATKSIPIVIKLQMPDKINRESRDSANMFRNEVNMYYEILPFLYRSSSPPPYPKVYHGVATGGEDYDKDILILENLRKFGYTSSQKSTFLDYEHLCIAMKTIAKLHSWSLTAKNKEPDIYSEMKSKVRVLDMKKTNEFDFELANYLSIKKGVEPFIKKGLYADLLLKFLKVTENLWEVVKLLANAEEPFGVIIHGDFCKNNMLFKYDKEERPVDGAFFDLQVSRYGSPVIDLAFFLYLHTDERMRREHWDDLLGFYWDSVRHEVPAEVNLPTFEEFLKHFAKRAVYGYFPCSFFLPEMLNPSKTLKIEDFEAMTQEEKLDRFLHVGNEEGARVVQNVVSHLIERKYIEKFLDFYEIVNSSSVTSDCVN